MDDKLGSTVTWFTGTVIHQLAPGDYGWVNPSSLYLVENEPRIELYDWCYPINEREDYMHLLVYKPWGLVVDVPDLKKLDRRIAHNSVFNETIRIFLRGFPNKRYPEIKPTTKMQTAVNHNASICDVAWSGQAFKALVVDPQMDFTQSYWRCGVPDKIRLLKLLHSHITDAKRYGLFVHIGAGLGNEALAILTRRLIQNAVLFEGITRNSHHLKVNVSINHLEDRVIVHPYAPVDLTALRDTGLLLSNRVAEFYRGKFEFESAYRLFDSANDLVYQKRTTGEETLYVESMGDIAGVDEAIRDIKTEMARLGIYDKEVFFLISFNPGEKALEKIVSSFNSRFVLDKSMFADYYGSAWARAKPFGDEIGYAIINP